MTDIRRVGTAGVSTVEGSGVAGPRAARLEREREAQRQAYDDAKARIKETRGVGTAAAGAGAVAGRPRIDDKFNSGSETQLEQEFRMRTVGLVSAEDFRRFREESAAAAAVAAEAADSSSSAALGTEARRAQEVKEERDRKRRAAIRQTLSFGGDDEEEEEGEEEVVTKSAKGSSKNSVNNSNSSSNNNSSSNTSSGGGGNGESGSDDAANGEEGSSAKRMRTEEASSTTSTTAANTSTSTTSTALVGSKKNPNVDTSFLPDRARDAAAASARDALRKEWLAEQEAAKKQLLEVIYSYWDGSGHRKAMRVPQGCTIGRFLELVKQQLAPEFHEMRGQSSDALMFVKEDLIIPHHFSFYDLIVTKARGKSGPLFIFDTVSDDVRLVNDVRAEKLDAHPAKVVDRRWFERQKHIFPYSRWEVYDGSREAEDERRRKGYTIHGDEVE